MNNYACKYSAASLPRPAVSARHTNIRHGLCRAAFLIVALCLLFSAHMAHAAVLVGHWAFDGNLQDSSPTGANGTLYDLVHPDGGSRTATVTTPAYTAGYYDQAISMNSYVVAGTPNTFYGQVMRAGDHAAYDFGTSTDFSLAGWFYWEARAGMTFHTIFASKQSRGSNRAGFMVSLDPINETTSRVYLRISDGVNHVSYSSDTIIGLQDWNHFAVTVNRSGSAQMYINGEVDGAPSNVTGVGNINAPAGVEFTVGATSFENQKDYFNGQLDDLRVYQGLLSPRDIWLLAGGVIPEPGTMGLMALGAMCLRLILRRSTGC
jgi:hypothetical protein